MRLVFQPTLARREAMRYTALAAGALPVIGSWISPLSGVMQTAYIRDIVRPEVGKRVSLPS